MKNQKGFSLIELLIVVVIIGIIAAIAIPNLIAARRSANEGSAQSTSRTIHSAQVTFQSTNGGGKFASSVTDLYTAKLVDQTVGQSPFTKSGYAFATTAFTPCKTGQTTDGCASVARPASFAVTSNPSVPAGGVTQTGTRSFCMATEGVFYQYKPAAVGGTAPTAGIIDVDNEKACSTGGEVIE